MTTLIIWQQGSHKCWAAWPGLGAASCPHCRTQHTALDSQVYTETASPGYNERAEIRLGLYSIYIKQLEDNKIQTAWIFGSDRSSRKANLCSFVRSFVRPFVPNLSEAFNFHLFFIMTSG